MRLPLIRVLVARSDITKLFIEPFPWHLTRQCQFLEVSVFNDILLEGLHDQTSESSPAGAGEDSDATNLAHCGGVLVETCGPDALVGGGVECYPMQAFRIDPILSVMKVAQGEMEGRLG